MRRKRRLFCCLTVFIGLLCGSCSNDIVYNQYQPIQNKIWEQSSAYFFVFKITDTTIPYNVSLQVRNNDAYPYQNLWMLCELSYDSIAVQDTIECMLADDFGRWKGSGHTLFQSQFALREQFHFPDTGQYTLTIRHGMRDDHLKGIEDIGVFIEKEFGIVHLI